MPATGYKGFNATDDGQLQCKDVIFTIGIEKHTDEPVILCKQGYHYCKKLQDVFKYYPTAKSHIYGTIIDIGSDTKTHRDKSVTNTMIVTSLLNGEFKDEGNTWHFKDGQFHRTDGPAIENVDGAKAWYINGHLHRTDGYAIINAYGAKSWYINGKLHRENGPAVEWEYNSKAAWYVNGQLHREDGPAYSLADGTQEWYINGQPHRDDGPAIEQPNGTKKWYRHGQLHREDGPAIERHSGINEWYINGRPAYMK